MTNEPPLSNRAKNRAYMAKKRLENRCMRKVVHRYAEKDSNNWAETTRVRLSCGHERRSNYRATTRMEHCAKCAKEGKTT